MAATGGSHISHSQDEDVIEVGTGATSSAVHRLNETNTKFVALSGEAKLATEEEKSMTVLEALRLYPRAVGWSVLFSTAIAMEEKVWSPEHKKPGTYQISAPWQAGLSNGARVGEILGLLLNGYLAERFGMKKTMIGSLILLSGLLFIPFFAQNIETLQVATILLGFPWGVFQTLTTAYASEVCPVALRGYLTTYVNMMWGVGQIIASGVLRSLLGRKDEWSWRIPYGLQWMWIPPLLIGLSFAPESPWWLTRKQRYTDARKALLKLTPASSTDQIDQTLSMMRHTDEVEKEISAGTSFLDCFKGVNLRRTEATCIAWVIQASCGASLIGYSAYFFVQAGLDTTVSFDFSIGNYGIAITGVFISWFAMTYLGRRTIYVGGLACCVTVMFTIGFVNLAHTTAASYATGSLILVFTLTYDITVGTLAYSLVTEIPSSRLRTKTIVLARALYNCQGIINGVITPYMLNPDYWNWSGKAGFFWGGLGSVYLVWAYFRLPEPKGRTYEEIDVLFEQKVSARKFSTTKLDLFRVDNQTELETVAEQKAE
ncbi:General alpha-glucoside permease [Cyphellophora attinorum]|uniref:General alpha-glucoside permease n=1 Tax=Cyphellophora attinorum TaxID=1664694 RepID=A0A0N1P0W8_9EURO|nr:General alpha-glucoside permease [Phialophora attinorum]KPI42725.1 General alpha-glucoside permease [Phialophora attinorum]